MTLAAAILLLGSSPLLIPGSMPQSRGTSPSQSGSAVTQEQPPQNPTQPGTSKSPSGQPSESASAKKTKRTTKPARRKKQVAPANCDPSPPTSTSSGTTSTAKADTQSAAAGISEAPKNCPPAKIVVQKGGITEQSIQLAGGSANDGTQKRDTANRMLAATEDNLKKISGRQLSTEQQDSATQIRQFVNQSKSAMAAGDLERAQTLAWKAKLLSDDLVNPGK